MKEKRKKKNQKRTIVLIAMVLVIAVAVGLVVLITTLTKNAENGTTESVERYEVFSMSTDKMERIEWQYKGNDYAVFKDGDVWKLEEDPDLELYQASCKAMASSLELITTEKYIEGVEKKDIGLELPSTVVKLKADGKTYEFRFGNENSTGGYYYLEYDGKISLVQSYEKTVFDKSILSLTGQEEPFETSLTKVEAEESSSEGEDEETKEESTPEETVTEAESAGLGETEPETGVMEDEETGYEDYTGMPDEDATYSEPDDISI